jgi:hypothetical protein
LRADSLDSLAGTPLYIVATNGNDGALGWATAEKPKGVGELQVTLDKHIFQPCLQADLCVFRYEHFLKLNTHNQYQIACILR